MRGCRDQAFKEDGLSVAREDEREGKSRRVSREDFKEDKVGREVDRSVGGQGVED